LTYIEKFTGTENARLISKAYVKIKFGYSYSSFEKSQSIKSINLNIRIPVFEKKIKFFVSSFKKGLSNKENVFPYEPPTAKNGNSISTGFEYNPWRKKLFNVNIRAGITTIKKAYLKTYLRTPKIIFKNISVEIEETARYESKIFKDEPVLQDYSRIYLSRLINKTSVLSLLIERSKREEDSFNTHFIGLSLSKIVGKSKKDVVSFSISRTGNKIIGAYPTEYNLSLNNRYKFQRWAYFNAVIGVNWLKYYHFKNNPYFRFTLEMYFGKW